MASWMIHLRIADALLDRIEDLDPIAFVMGSIAPDSGVPNSDWSQFSPPKSVSHYYVALPDGKTKRIDIEAFCADYFSPLRIRSYSKKEYSFFLGYYIHLLTDIAWAEKIYIPTKSQHSQEYAENRASFTEKMKEDWYDLDFRFLHEYPDFRAFRIFGQAEGFVNEYMKEFSADAFDDRRKYICGFYRGDEHGQLYRDYLYLDPARADEFVRETVDSLIDQLSIS